MRRGPCTGLPLDSAKMFDAIVCTGIINKVARPTCLNVLMSELWDEHGSP